MKDFSHGFLYGAIAGDIAGSPYEHCRAPRTINSYAGPLFAPASRFTDDTVLTLAVAEGLIEGGGDPQKTPSALIASIRRLALLYPNAGYGVRFKLWLRSEDPRPYNSFGNGSAMRVSPAGWFFDSLPQTERFAEIAAAVTHNHPEGIRGACAAASGIFLARTGASAEDIRSYITGRYGYDLSGSFEAFRASARPSVTCMDTLPIAFMSFLSSDSFEDALRRAISFGGDTDTQAAIAGSLAEAYWGVPGPVREAARSRLPQPLLSILDRAVATKPGGLSAPAREKDAPPPPRPDKGRPQP